MKLKYFKIKGGIITPIGKNSYYWFDVEELKRPHIEGQSPCMISHISRKNWVTPQMIHELILIAKELYPEVDHTITLIEIIEYRENLKAFSKFLRDNGLMQNVIKIKTNG